MSFRVQTQGYSGPFDLLLQLVTKKKVSIGAISISEVAEQYIDEVERMGDLDLEVASDFVLVASTLLDIKAASLVPEEPIRVPDEDLEDAELSDLDPAQAREVLIERLIAYKQFRNAAAALGARYEAEGHMVPRTAGPDPEFLGLMPDYTKGITISSLAVICADLDSRHEHFLLEAEHIAPKRISLALVMASVDRFTRSRGSCTFDELIEGSKDPEKVVAAFLAVLTLYHRGMIEVEQEENFGPIGIERVPGAPAYDPAEDMDEFEEVS